MKLSVIDRVKTNFSYDKKLYSLYIKKYNSKIDKYFFTQEFLKRIEKLNLDGYDFNLENYQEAIIKFIYLINPSINNPNNPDIFKFLEKFVVSEELLKYRTRNILDDKIYLKYFSLIDNNNIEYYENIWVNSYNFSDADKEKILKNLVNDLNLINIENYKILLDDNIIKYKDDYNFYKIVNYLLKKDVSNDIIAKELSISNYLQKNGNIKLTVEQLDEVSSILNYEDLEKCFSDSLELVFSEYDIEIVKILKKVIDKNYSVIPAFNYIYENCLVYKNFNLANLILDTLEEEKIFNSNEIKGLTLLFPIYSSILKGCCLNLDDNKILKMLSGSEKELFYDIYERLSWRLKFVITNPENFKDVSFSFLINFVLSLGKDTYNKFCLELINQTDNVVNIKKFITEQMFSPAIGAITSDEKIYQDNYYKILKEGDSKYNQSNDNVKNFFDVISMIENSNDLDFIKRAISKYLQAYDVPFVVREIIHEVKKERITNQLKNLTTRKDLEKYPKSYIGDVAVYHLVGNDYKFISHAIGMNYNALYTPETIDERTNPEYWTNNRNIDSEFISSSLINASNMNVHRGGPIEANLKIRKDFVILLFDNIPIDQVRYLSSTDAKSPIGRLVNGSKREVSLKEIKEINMVDFSDDNEITFDRELPNGMTRLPFAILVADTMTLNEDSKAMKWARYYNIPLVMYHTIDKSYEQNIETTKSK